MGVEQTPPRNPSRRSTPPVSQTRGHRRGATSESFDSFGSAEVFFDEHGMMDSPGANGNGGNGASNNGNGGGRYGYALPPTTSAATMNRTTNATNAFMEHASVERQLSSAVPRPFQTTHPSGRGGSDHNDSFPPSPFLSFQEDGGVERTLSSPDLPMLAVLSSSSSSGGGHNSINSSKGSGFPHLRPHLFHGGGGGSNSSNNSSSRRSKHNNNNNNDLRTPRGGGAGASNSNSNNGSARNNNNKPREDSHSNSSDDSDGSGNTALSTPPKIIKTASGRSIISAEYNPTSTIISSSTTKDTSSRASNSNHDSPTTMHHHNGDDDDDASAAMYADSSRKRGRRNKLLALLCVAIVGVAIGAGIAASGGGSSSNSVNDSSQQVESPSAGPPRPTRAPAQGPPAGTPLTQSTTIDASLLAVNNECSTAIGPLTINGPMTVGSNLNATVSNVAACGQVVENGRGVWYHVTGGDEVIRASTCDGSDFDTQLSVFQGANCNALECVVGSDEFCGSQSSASWFAKKGVQYYIYVHGWGTEIGTFGLTVAYEENSSCLSSIGPIDADGTVTVGSLRGGSFDKLFSCDGVAAINGVVWYSVYGTGEWMVASTCHSITEFSARIAVVVGGCNTISCAAVRDSDCGNGFRANWKSIPGVLYHILVFKDNNFDGSLIGLSVNEFTPVANDACAGAVPMQIGGGVQQGSTLEATIDNAPSRPCGAQNLQPGVWYSVQGNGAKLLASTCNDDTLFSTEIAVFRGSCSDEELECITADDQFCGEKASVYWDTIAGETYYVFVHGSDYGLFENVGDFGLTVDEFVPEENDNCVDAIALDAVGDRVQGSTFASTDDGVSQCNGIQSDAPGVWYSVQTTVGTVVRASTCDPETDFDTQISIFRGSCGSLTCVITDDNSCGFQSSVAWSASAGVTYFIFVHGREKTSVGDFALTLSEYSPAIANDFCDTGIALAGDGSLVTGSTDTASFDNVGRCSVDNTGPGVWYEVEGTGTTMEASLCNDATNFETAISVFSGDCLNLECVTGNRNGDSGSCGSKSETSWVALLDTTYYILVHGWDVRVGEFGLTVKELPSAVGNDFCVRATQLSIGSQVITGSTVDATVDATPTCSGVASVAPGVWYQVNGNGERLIASTCNGDGRTETDFDTRISVFHGDCGNLECIVGDDNGCSLQSRVIWQSEPGETYYIHVHGAANKFGNYGLVVDDFVPLQDNDFCAGAQGPLIPDGTVVAGSTTGSSFDDVGFCGTANTGPGVWFYFVGTGERLTADSCDAQTNYDTKISVFSGFNCAGLTCVDGVDDGCGLQSSISFDTEVSVTYWILLHGWGANRVGQYGLTLSGSAFFGSFGDP